MTYSQLISISKGAPDNMYHIAIICAIIIALYDMLLVRKWVQVLALPRCFCINIYSMFFYNYVYPYATVNSLSYTSCVKKALKYIHLIASFAYYVFCIFCEIVLGWRSMIQVNIGSGNGLVPSGSNALFEPLMTNISMSPYGVTQGKIG